MNTAAAGSKPLGGDAGYKRLVRLLARAFYAGECPPKEAEPEDVPAAARIVVRRDKNDYSGLGLLLLDLLAAAHGYVKDVAITGQLGVSGKVANRALRHLQSEGLLQSEVTKIKVKRQTVEQPDDPEVEARMSQQTNTWWCVAYPALLDSLHLRLHRMRALLKKHMGSGEDVAEYLCRRCGATYTSLDTYKLLDRTTGIFHCEECGGQAEANIDAAGLGSASGAAASRQQLQQYAKRMTEKVEAQLRPILEQLDKLKDVPPPDFGSLRDWHRRQHDLQRRRQEQAARARQKMAARGGSHDDLDDDQVLDWLARAEVDVQLAGEGSAAAAAAAGPGKELPAWFRGAESESVGVTASQDVPDGEAEQKREQQAQQAQQQQQQPGGDASEQKRLQEAFLAQYLAQVQAAARQEQGDLEQELLPDAKRIKTESGRAGVKVEQGAWELAAGEEPMWEDVKEDPGQLQPQQQQQPEAASGSIAAGGDAAEEDDWEDI